MDGCCQVMGILNVTPDSFSDGGKYFTVEEAVRRAVNMAKEGAAFIDVGGESTRPGATPLKWEEEWSRIEPVLEILRTALHGFNARISVDTYHPETALRAVSLGASMVNCVYPEPVPEMLEILDANPEVELTLPAVSFPLAASTIPVSRLYIDPMIGFGTTREEDLELLKSIPALTEKCRVLVGASRKRIVKRLTGAGRTGKTLGGNIAIAVWCALCGAAAVRVHDVAETVEAVKVAQSLKGRGWILPR